MAILDRYFKQTRVLVRKTFLVVLVRHAFFTVFRAFFLPVAFMFFIAYAKNLFIPPSHYGIQEQPIQIPNLAESIGKNEKLVFVHNNLGPTVDKLIDQVAKPVRDAGKGEVLVLNNTDNLLKPCKQNLLGDSKCFAAVVFNSLPTGSDNGSVWNYTIRGNIARSLSPTVKINSHTNDQQSLLPLQLAVDNAILDSKTGSDVDESIYTSLSEQQRRDRVRIRYNGAIIKVLGVAFFIGMVPVVYHCVGLLATEREAGLSQLIAVMGGSQAARLSSIHISFTVLYLPGWIIMALILKFAVFSRSSVLISLALHIFGGVSVVSASLFAGAWFRKAQLSGIISTLVVLLLAIVAQVLSKSGTGTVATLGLLFPPMSYVYFLHALAHFEQKDVGLSLIKAPPDSNSKLPAIVLLLFLLIQSVAFFFLAGFVENFLYGTSSKTLSFNSELKDGLAVEVKGLTKRYPVNWFKRMVSSKKEPVIAVSSLDLCLRQGEISVLLGANGSGKTTTLEMISGLNRISSGHINVKDKKDCLSICPQKNVLWDDLTVEETVQIFSGLKCSDDSKATCEKLIKDCDLFVKRKALCKTLSGGQKRKAQLAVCFAGDPTICLIDEITSGLDPVSRRKIHDIIMKERGRKSMIITSHYLSEAESIADKIVILSKGELKCEGSVAELKTKLGGGYRVYCKGDNLPEEIDGFLSEREQIDQTVYFADDATSTGRLIQQLTSRGHLDYRVHGPSIEDVFLKVSEEATGVKISRVPTKEKNSKDRVRLQTGKRVKLLRQIWIMFQKRLLILMRNPWPTSAAITIPIITAALTMRFVNNFTPAGCSIKSGVEASDFTTFDIKDLKLDVVVGPPSSFPLSKVTQFETLLGSALGIDPSNSTGANNQELNATYLMDAIHFVDSIEEFKDTIEERYQNITPGGVWYTGKPNDTPLISFKANGGVGLFNSIFLLNILTNLRSSASSATNGSLIFTGYKDFDYTWPSGTGDSLLFITYFGLAMSVFPAFFCLYPTAERIKKVRNMQYSNGVRPAALWIAYTLFDLVAVLVVSVVTIAIFAASASIWFELGYLWFVFFLYGLAMTLGVYVVSLICKSQLSAFAVCSGGSCIAFLLYMIAYMSILTYSPLEKQQGNILISHYVFSLFFPISSLLRALFASLNLFQILCKHEKFVNGAHLEAYGSPILFLIIQILFCICVLLCWDGGFFGAFGSFARRPAQVKENDDEHKQRGIDEKQISEEIRRVDSLKEGLRVMDVTKAFGKKNIAVQDVTFAVNKGEVMGLLGPNGAGKSTTISLIRGDIQPTRGEILIGDISVRRHRTDARDRLGVCPQFDFLESMTVTEILTFYSKIRGIENVDENVTALISAVGLGEFCDRMASKLSGGNKRKLSLAISLTGDPLVLLLDEPSSALDAAAKRAIWTTISSIAHGRSIILTSHDMEESAFLCHRILLLNRQVLTLGTSEFLREKHGAFYHVQLVLKSAPDTTQEEVERTYAWIKNTFPKAVIEDREFHGGQIKFKLPLSYGNSGSDVSRPGSDESEAISEVPRTSSAGDIPGQDTSNVVSKLFTTLGQEQDDLGIAYWSVSQTSLEDVFLAICGDAVEEGYSEENKESAAGKWRKLFSFKK